MTVSAFANTQPKLNYSSTDFTPKYKSPELVNYNKPLSVPQTNNLVEGGGFNIKPLNQLGGGETPWYKDGNAMQGYAGLASSFAQLASLPGQLKLAKLQRQGLQQNINQQKVDNQFRASARANLNAPITNTGSV